MKTYNLCIEVLTPLHIGDAQGRLSALEFFQDRHAVYLVNEKVWAQKLSAIHGIDNFIHYVEMEERASLDDFLEKLGASRAKHLQQETVLRRIPKGEQFRLWNFQPFIFDRASLMPYIPGTSLKGAIRGSLLYYLFGKSQRTGAIKQQALRRNRRAGADVDDLLRAELEGRNRHAIGPNSDWLRFLQVTDAYPEHDDSTEVREVRVLSLNNNNGYHFGARNARLFVETIKPGVMFHARVKLDQETWKIFKENTGQKPPFALENWLEVSMNKAHSILTKDQEFFRQANLPGMAKELKQLKDRGANLRLGWGAGLSSTSVVLHFTPEERRALRDNYFQRRYHNEFPQSRKVVMANNQPESSFGWVRLTLS